MERARITPLRIAAGYKINLFLYKRVIVVCVWDTSQVLPLSVSLVHVTPSGSQLQVASEAAVHAHDLSNGVTLQKLCITQPVL